MLIPLHEIAIRSIMNKYSPFFDVIINKFGPYSIVIENHIMESEDYIYTKYPDYVPDYEVFMERDSKRMSYLAEILYNTETGKIVDHGVERELKDYEEEYSFEVNYIRTLAKHLAVPTNSRFVYCKCNKRRDDFIFDKVTQSSIFAVTQISDLFLYREFERLGEKPSDVKQIMSKVRRVVPLLTVEIKEYLLDNAPDLYYHDADGGVYLGQERVHTYDNLIKEARTYYVDIASKLYSRDKIHWTNKIELPSWVNKDRVDEYVKAFSNPIPLLEYTSVAYKSPTSDLLFLTDCGDVIYSRDNKDYFNRLAKYEDADIPMLKKVLNIK